MNSGHDSRDADLGRVRIVFEIPQGQDGYPPSTSEGLWAIRQKEGQSFILDNIPFYAKGVSSGDLIRATRDEDGQLIYREILEPSGNSTFRLYVSDADFVQRVRDDLRKMGCPSELSNVPNLVAVEVPAEVSIEVFLDYIVESSDDGKLEYEEAALRHALPS